MGEIWDCFMFNDELDLLELRLRHLDGVIDRVVLVEADRTHSGIPKPLVFNENRDRFREWATKIDHVVATLSESAPTPGDRENEHRRAVRDHLTEALHPGVSLVVFGDPDEVPVPQLLPRLDAAIDRHPVRLVLRHCVYFANWMLAEPWDNSTLVMRPAHLSEPMPRAQLGDAHGDWHGYREHQIMDAGVHLSFLGGAQEIRAKWSAYRHQTDFDNWRFAAAPHLERLVDYGIHFQGRDVLRRLRRDELDDQLQALASMPLAQQFFRFEEAPVSPATLQAYCAYTWLRLNAKLPRSLCDAVDRHPASVERVLKPALVALDTALRARRQRAVVPDWRQPTLHPWPTPS